MFTNCHIHVIKVTETVRLFRNSFPKQRCQETSGKKGNLWKQLALSSLQPFQGGFLSSDTLLPTLFSPCPSYWTIVVSYKKKMYSTKGFLYITKYGIDRFWISFAFECQTDTQNCATHSPLHKTERVILGSSVLWGGYFHDIKTHHLSISFRYFMGFCHLSTL